MRHRFVVRRSDRIAQEEGSMRLLGYCWEPGAERMGLGARSRKDGIGQDRMGWGQKEWDGMGWGRIG